MVRCSAAGGYQINPGTGTTRTFGRGGIADRPRPFGKRLNLGVEYYSPRRRHRVVGGGYRGPPTSPSSTGWYRTLVPSRRPAARHGRHGGGQRPGVLSRAESRLLTTDVFLVQGFYHAEPPRSPPRHRRRDRDPARDKGPDCSNADGGGRPAGPHCSTNFFQENLRFRPESATNLGLDKGPNADLKSRLSDESLAGVAKAKAMTADQLARMARIDRIRPLRRRQGELRHRALHSALGRRDPGLRLRRPVLRPVALCRQPADRRLPVGPGLPRHQAPDRNRRRRRGLSRAARRLRHGARPEHRPDEARRRRRRRAAGLHPRPRPDPDGGDPRQPADTNLLVTSIARRTAAKGIAGDWAARATALYNDKVGPGARSSDRRDPPPA